MWLTVDPNPCDLVHRGFQHDDGPISLVAVATVKNEYHENKLLTISHRPLQAASATTSLHGTH